MAARRHPDATYLGLGEQLGGASSATLGSCQGGARAFEDSPRSLLDA